MTGQADTDKRTAGVGEVAGVVQRGKRGNNSRRGDWRRLQNAPPATELIKVMQKIMAYATSTGARPLSCHFTTRHLGSFERTLDDLKSRWWKFQQTETWRGIEAAVWVFGTHGRPHVHLAVALPRGVTIRAFMRKWTGGISSHPTHIYDVSNLAAYFGAQRSSFARIPRKRRRLWGSRLPPAGHLVYACPSSPGAIPGSPGATGSSPSPSSSSLGEGSSPRSGSTFAIPVAPDVARRAGTGGEIGSAFPTMQRPESPTSCCTSSSERAQPGRLAGPQQVGEVELSSPPRGSEPIPSPHLSVAAVPKPSNAVKANQGEVMTWNFNKRAPPQQFSPQGAPAPASAHPQVQSVPNQHPSQRTMAVGPTEARQFRRPTPMNQVPAKQVVAQPVPQAEDTHQQVQTQQVFVPTAQPKPGEQYRQVHQHQQPQPVQMPAPVQGEVSSAMQAPAPFNPQPGGQGQPASTWTFPFAPPASAAPAPTAIQPEPPPTTYVNQAPAPVQYVAGPMQAVAPHACRCGICGRNL